MLSKGEEYIWSRPALLDWKIKGLSEILRQKPFNNKRLLMQHTAALLREPHQGKKAGRAMFVGHAADAYHQENRALHSGAVKSRYADMKREVAAQYRPGLLTMLDRHRAADEDADRARQKRAAERDQDQQRFEEKLRQIERMQKGRKRGRDRSLDR